MVDQLFSNVCLSDPVFGGTELKAGAVVAVETVKHG